MSPAPLPVLPPDVLGRIARAALAAEDDDVRAWGRLSLVCRTWRDSLRGTSSWAARSCMLPKCLSLVLVTKFWL